MESSLQLQTSWTHETRIREWRNVYFELTGSHRRHCTSAKDFYDILAELSKNQRSRSCSEVAGLDVVAGIIASFCSNAPIGGLRDNLSDQWFYRAMEILLQMVMLKNTSNHLQQEPLPSSLTTLPTCRFLENETRSILQIIHREDVLSNQSFAYPFDLWLKIAYPGNDFLKSLPKMFTSGCLHLAGHTKEVLHILARSKAKPENIGLFSANYHKYFSCPSTSSSGEVKTLETYHSRGRETHFTFPRKMRKWHPSAILASGDTSTPMSTTNINDSEPLEFLPLFHKALKKNVEYLISISARLAENVGRLEEFRQVFNILQQRHRLYGDAKGQFIIPALEAKTKLLNVSWSYTFDHELEAKYLDKVSAFLDEIFKFQNLGYITGQKRMNVARLCCELCHTCQSFHGLLSDHISTEGNELWPFFSQCFSVKEQEKIIANILGRTSAETIQSIIPWLTSCLPREDQHVMMSLWRKIAKNTMFDDWLEEWWFGYGTDGAEVSSSSAVLRYLSGEVLEEQCDPMSDKGVSCSREECLVDNIELLEKCGLAVKDQDSAEEKAKHCEVADMTDRVDLSEQTKSKFVPRRNRCKRHLTMNQDHPETAMRRVSCDPATDSESTKNKESSQKLFRQQNLHTEAANSPDSNNIPGQHPSYRDPLEQTFGCRHYKRSCKLVTSCCNQLYTCIRCHDEESDHSTKRRAISEMMCMKCLVIQPIAQKCSSDSCNNFSMGRYYCSVCKLFDDEREIYHCPYCNLCRVGKGLGIKYFHCMNCNACMSESLSVHICREKCFENNCPICHEYIFTSSEPVKSLPCGHLMHSTCFKEYTCSRYTCPICSKSLGDMQVYFQKLDDELAAEEIPEECSGKYQAILCNDCEKKGSAAFHWVHHKCSYCGSYNTRLI